MALRSKRLSIQIIGKCGIEQNDGFKEYANFISNSFTFWLVPVLIKGVNKLIVELLPEPDALFVFPEIAGESIYTIRETFDFSQFESANPTQKKVLITKATAECLKILYRHLSLDELNVDRACRSILENDFSLIVPLFGKAKQNRSKTTQAIALVEFLVGQAVIRVDFSDKSGMLLKQVELFYTPPVYFIISQIVKSTKWLNNEWFMLSNDSKEINFLINSSGQISAEYNPVERDVSGLKEQIAYLTSGRTFEL